MTESTIRNQKLVGQVVDFKGVKFGLCSATDIDMSIDWQGKTFVFTELKYGEVPLPVGQRLHLESLVNAIEAGGKRAYALIARHNTPEGQPIVAAEAQVSAVCDRDGWKYISVDKSRQTVIDYLSSLHKLHLERNK